MKYRLFLHPHIRKLNAFAEGDRKSAGRFTRRHLSKCETCRSQVRFLRQLRLQTKKIPVPSAPEDLLHRIETGISRNDVVLLPARDPEQRRDRPLLVPIAAAGLVAFGVWAFRPTSTAEAGTQYGELQLAPDHLGSKGTISVKYRPGSILAGAEAVVLRARFRSANNPEYNDARRQVAVAQLHRGNDGVYRGNFSVPDSVVYAALAVEDPTGKRVDHNAWRLWELLEESSAGVPSFAALEQRANDLQGRNLEEALRTVQRRASLFSHLPQGWADVVFFERLMFGQTYADSVAASHRARLYGFDEKLRPVRVVPFETMQGMLAYASAMYDSAFPRVVGIHRYWTQRETAQPSNAFSARENRAYMVSDSASKSPKIFLPVLDSLWKAEGPDFSFVASNAFLFAQRAGDDAATILWADRSASISPNASVYYYKPLLKNPRLADTALARLRNALPRLYRRQDSLRPLERNVEEQARFDHRLASAILESIGTTLLARGRVRDGIDALERATEQTWDVDLFRETAEARLSAGDTVGALHPLAFVAADPATSSDYRDSAISRFGNVIGPQAWIKLVDRAESEMRRRVLAEAIFLGYKSPVRLTGMEGIEKSLEQIAMGKVTVVAFWSRFCGPSRQLQIPKLDSLARQLNRYDIVLVPVTDESPSRGVAEFLRAQHVTTPVYFDKRGDARRAFSQWGTPWYDVIDGNGHIRFAHTGQERVLTQAVALSREMERKGSMQSRR